MAAIHSGPTVLLADRDPDAATMYGIGLEAAGYRVRIARSARALFFSLDALTNVLVTEWERLGIPGREIIRRARSVRRPEPFPIVVLTNHDGEVERLRNEAMEAGASAWLVKANTTPQQLASSIEKALGGPAS
jgi:DNA-binding response OmpR family regulator